MAQSAAKLDATASTKSYEFGVCVTRPSTGWCRAQRTEALLTVHDGPGGALFPRAGERTPPGAPLGRWEAKMLSHASTANALVVCVDATRSDIANLAGSLPVVLGRLAERSSQATAYPPMRWRHRLTDMFRGRRGRRTSVGVERWLGADRVLLLLTKIDKLVARVVGKRRVAERPVDIAARIDPIRQACELLGESFLYQILGVLPPTAVFAVGATSAWGFASHDGWPFRMLQRRTTPSVRDWQPLGVKEAVVFMLTGEVIGTIRQVGEADLDPRRRMWAVPALSVGG